MKKPKIHLLVVITLIFAAFTLGLYIGRNYYSAQPVTVSLPAAMQTLPPETTEETHAPTEETTAILFPVPINQASAEELMALPGIGEVLARRIIAYRDENGPFPNAEALMHVKGIGKKRLEDILDMITIGG